MKDKDFKDLLTSIGQARKIHSKDLKASRIFKFNPLIVKKIRKKLHATQAEFAYMIGVSKDTLQNWEQGRRKPEGPALALLKIADAAPEVIMQALHA
ncbi:MAG: type II toxin-antitoxin system MqsA family antitoxin [Candidatus Omnitrophica bacterium]|nr:type II toxin-antitoxin system MqsA family antitoxin [Candidatus Omnitrophota bacterium]